MDEPRVALFHASYSVLFSHHPHYDASVLTRIAFRALLFTTPDTIEHV